MLCAVQDAVSPSNVVYGKVRSPALGVASKYAAFVWHSSVVSVLSVYIYLVKRFRYIN